MQEEDVPTVFNATVNVTIRTDTGKAFSRSVNVQYTTNSNPDKNKVYTKILKLALPKIRESQDVR